LFKNCKAIYFSNQSDLNQYQEDTGLKMGKVYNWYVVPTPSNILPCCQNNHNRDVIQLVHFGQIRPNKGLEQVLLLFQMLSNDKTYKVNLKLVGGIPKGYDEYANEIVKQFINIGVETKLNLTSKELSNELSNSDYGVFIFPDGADERRGSLIAALAHEVICFTNYSNRTPLELRSITIGVDGNKKNNKEIVDALYDEISLYLNKKKNIKDGLICDVIKYSSEKSFSNISKKIISEFGL
jgi:glycosyltransferase involved in cell wall biosynthesis